MLCFWANERKFQGLMLEYGTKFLTERPLTFFYIPVFILFAIGLVALITWQHSCFASVFHSNNNFFDFNNTGFWEILNILELIWGLSFLRDACTSTFIKSIFVFLAILLIGTGTDLTKLHAMLLTRDYSANIGVALLEDLSLTHSWLFLDWSLNYSFATLKPVVQVWAQPATTPAAGSPACSTWSVQMLTHT